jgi:hypothetical protein
LPMTGQRDSSSGGLPNVGTRGDYWSSTVSSASSRRLYFYSSNALMGTIARAAGRAVRCIQDIPD